jgi:hypothetical protein
MRAYIKISRENYGTINSWDQLHGCMCVVYGHFREIIACSC